MRRKSKCCICYRQQTIQSLSPFLRPTRFSSFYQPTNGFIKGTINQNKSSIHLQLRYNTTISKTAKMFKKLPNFHSLVRTAGLKVSGKTCFFLQKVKLPGNIFSNKTKHSFAKIIHDLKQMKTPGNKQDAMRVSGSIGCFSHYIKNM